MNVSLHRSIRSHYFNISSVHFTILQGPPTSQMVNISLVTVVMVSLFLPDTKKANGYSIYGPSPSGDYPTCISTCPTDAFLANQIVRVKDILDSMDRVKRPHHLLRDLYNEVQNLVKHHETLYYLLSNTYGFYIVGFSNEVIACAKKKRYRGKVILSRLRTKSEKVALFVLSTCADEN